jgi:aspartyl-tRNA(Asn)/glutamyl-tRNA(Gln) amidotransferase subunit A
MTVRELGHQLRSRKLSCVELVQQTLKELQGRDRFRCLVTLTGEPALAEARERDRELAAGQDRGPFHGIPIAYKDLFYTRGVRTTGGSLIFKDFVPSHDAAAVERFHAAGAISVGKTNLHEIALGITSKNPHYGFVLNPLDPRRIPGGSSGGSAALVAGNFLPVALGTDTGGSIRVPAAYCGVVGLKPTYGRVSRYGVLPLAFSLDHVGPLGASVEDCALAMNVLAGPDARDPACSIFPAPEFNRPPLANLQGLRVGVPANFFFEHVTPEVAAAVWKAISKLERLGAALEEVTLPDLAAANAAARIVQLSETAAIYVKHTDAKLFGEDVWALLEQGRMIHGHEYVNAQRIRTLFRRDFDALWTKIDVLAAPTSPITAPLLEQNTVTIAGHEENVRIASTRLVRSLNFLGEPAVSMPCGKDANDMPAGLQLISAPFTEPKLLQIARTLSEP